MNMMKAPLAFIQVLHKQPVACPTPKCAGPVGVEELTRPADRVKSFALRCEHCEWKETISGDEQVDPPWDEGSLMELTEEHLLHLEPVCPYDQAPVEFHSLPNPRRRARYQISCFFCGRQVVLDWPPEEAKR